MSILKRINIVNIILGVLTTILGISFILNDTQRINAIIQIIAFMLIAGGIFYGLVALVEKVRFFKIKYIIASCINIIFGLCLMIFESNLIDAILIMCGVLMLTIGIFIFLSGIGSLIFKDNINISGSLPFVIITSLILITIGYILVSRPALFSALFSIIAGIGFILIGIHLIINSFNKGKFFTFKVNYVNENDEDEDNNNFKNDPDSSSYENAKSVSYTKVEED